MQSFDSSKNGGLITVRFHIGGPPKNLPHMILYFKCLNIYLPKSLYITKIFT